MNGTIAKTPVRYCRICGGKQRYGGISMSVLERMGKAFGFPVEKALF